MEVDQALQARIIDPAIRVHGGDHGYDTSAKHA
jgi:hypothetical protein